MESVTHTQEWQQWTKAAGESDQTWNITRTSNLPILIELKETYADIILSSRQYE